jgi:hypothetical protein
MGDDVESKMMAALMFEPANDTIVEEVTFDEQVSFLKKYINTVAQSDRLDIGRLLIMNDKKESLVDCGEGVVINLNAIPKIIVRQMYDMLKCKVDKLKE